MLGSVCDRAKLLSTSNAEALLVPGTIGREMEEQTPDIDTLLVAVGGGGLIAGITAWFCSKLNAVGVAPA
jgi:threonine dehydratase